MHENPLVNYKRRFIRFKKSRKKKALSIKVDHSYKDYNKTELISKEGFPI
jgi:hypothetical protein